MNISLLLQRLVFGGGMAYWHGLSKLMGYAEMSAQFPDPLGVGSSVSLGLCIFAELVCGTLLALGLFSRLSLIPLITTMAVAFFIIHGADPMKDKEMALLYLCNYISLLLSGPGTYSVQHIFKLSAGRFGWLLS